MSDVTQLYDSHRDGVFRYLRRIVGGTDAATDLTQEVFLRVSRAGLPETTPVGQRAWLFRIARNLALNHVRDGRRRPVEVELGDAVTPGTQELGVAMRRAIEALPALDRDIFLLREIVGLRYDEIAAACDVTVDSVRARLHQTRQTLRRTLAGPLDVRAQRGVRCVPAAQANDK